MAKPTRSPMKVLKVLDYKEHPIYIRMVGKDVFIWDMIHENQLYTGYIVMKPAKGRSKLTQAEIDEVIKMCFAGGATSVDQILGVELTDDDETMVRRFEGARSQVEAEPIIN
jgi:hypothetical protein